MSIRVGWVAFWTASAVWLLGLAYLGYDLEVLGNHFGGRDLLVGAAAGLGMVWMLVWGLARRQ